MAENSPRLNEAHGHSAATPHHKVNYFLIFGILVGLTILTVGVAFLPIHHEWIKVLLALTIASIKASFVAIFFMHLKFEGKLIYFIMIVPLSFTVVLICALIPDIVMPALHNMMLGRPY
ncbi:MAG TPA: cytochrome C oxidase subunit IV family protein [Tepidisphaeraceae bacterium]|jgi:cytochrome c oxidase subunit 4|nr:cytochrome C oxidase subunit IV family protein [Tepidisphaeraceae bacterium]